jgi:hypothetical protein
MSHSGLTYVGRSRSSEEVKESGFNLEQLFIKELINIEY